ncbi:MAG: cytochrome c3 family protein [Gemmatimonadales bacterium]|jgi:predicted CXXCH cytochrome family protein
MHSRRPFVSSAAFVLPILVLAASACTDTKTKEVIVEVEKPLYEDPPAGAAGFLGYDEQADKLTVCGNCHVGQQAEWEGTAHADAWATLEASGHASASCENCHTDGPNGNPTDEGGWAATADTRYHDVQCENCHGPGETHVTNPDASQPLASIAVSADPTVGCAECHSGAHHPFVEDWSNSAHSQVVSYTIGREECAACHSGQGIISAWGENANYIEKNAAETQPIVCAVCHDPHDATNAGQLRFPVETTSIETHLCARCHNRRTIPDPSSSHGLEPHAPEAALLVGDAGWFPPGSIIEDAQIRGTHGSEANEGLCATCHVASFQVNDAETGAFLVTATGHLFEAIPCVDAQGIPVGGDCEVSTTARAFNGCTGAGCHGDETAAFSALTSGVGAVETAAADLLAQLETVDPNLDGAGGAIDAADPTFTTAEGAFFNYNLAMHGGDAVGSAVHNPFLMEALLLASQTAVENEYGVAAAVAGYDRTARIQYLVDTARNH